MVQYALGEARWHGQFLERGLATLEAAFQRDPHWQMALVHVVEYRLSHGETASLAPIVKHLRTVDPSAAAALDCKIAVADRQYAQAVIAARAAIEGVPAIPDLFVCLVQAQILAGDLDGAEKMAKDMLERWPIDLREWGAVTLANELLLYRGKFAEYVDRLAGKGSRQRDMALALWAPQSIPHENEATEPKRLAPGEFPTSMRPPPLGTASELVVQHALGLDPVWMYDGDPQPEVRAFGKGMAAERAKDMPTAIAEYRRAVEQSAKGDLRMLASYYLARALHATGDAAGAAAACEDVIAPRVYQGYRALLLPDCVLWSGDRARGRQLLQGWTGELALPAIVELRAM
jgi:tetratricopeptide (TPR) repeat protein